VLVRAGVLPPPLHYDVAVLGAGLGGVSAALRAAELGCKVVLIEAGDHLGGTAYYSGGGIHIWGCHSYETYRQRCPTANDTLLRTLYDNYGRYVQWLLATGAPGTFGSTTLRGLQLEKYQIGGSMLPAAKRRWFDFLERYLQRLNCRVLFATRATKLHRSRGAVCGVEVESQYRKYSIEANNVVIATGGFQNNTGLLQRYVSPVAEDFVCRAVTDNDGAGMRMALEVGAVLNTITAAGTEMATVYGHLMPAAPCRIDWRDPLDATFLSAFYAAHALVVNVNGKRFVDEAGGELNGLTINAATQQPAGGLWIVMDEAIRRKHAQYELPAEVLRPASLRHWRQLRYLRLRRDASRLYVALDSLAYARDRGALIVTASALAALEAQMTAVGVDGAALRATIDECNLATDRCEGAKLAIPRANDAGPLRVPPFHAIKVAPGISMTYGGIAIDNHARALTTSGVPLPGLYAVPGAAGGVQHRYYGGALAACGVFGMIAGEAAAD
jgi:succinate dehydrogenase/fumarate reductase flavoprotein subunit